MFFYDLLQSVIVKFPEAATGSALIRTPFLENTSRWLLLSFHKKILTNLKNVRQMKVQKRFIYGKKRKAWNRGKPTQMSVTITESLAAIDKSRLWFCLRRLPSLDLYKRILNSPCFLILLIPTKHKTMRWNFGLTPRFYSLEGALIHWVDKAKIGWLTVGQLPKKAG